MSYNVGNMAQKFLPSHRKGLDYELIVIWRKDSTLSSYLQIPSQRSGRNRSVFFRLGNNSFLDCNNIRNGMLGIYKTEFNKRGSISNEKEYLL